MTFPLHPRNKTIKVPTASDIADFYASFKEYAQWTPSPHLWAEVGADYRCPICNRARNELIRWTTIGDKTRLKAAGLPEKSYKLKGWTACINVHHDHNADYFNVLERFGRTAICDQCNWADGQAKQRLKLPYWFSFSPSEIKQFVRGTPHGWHELDLDKALEIYNNLFPDVVIDYSFNMDDFPF